MTSATLKLLVDVSICVSIYLPVFSPVAFADASYCFCSNYRCYFIRAYHGESFWMPTIHLCSSGYANEGNNMSCCNYNLQQEGAAQIEQLGMWHFRRV